MWDHFFLETPFSVKKNKQVQNTLQPLLFVSKGPLCKKLYAWMKVHFVHEKKIYLKCKSKWNCPWRSAQLATVIIISFYSFPFYISCKNTIHTRINHRLRNVQQFKRFPYGSNYKIERKLMLIQLKTPPNYGQHICCSFISFNDSHACTGWRVKRK